MSCGNNCAGCQCEPVKDERIMLLGEFAEELKQLCKDFSDQRDRPYMGDVTAAFDDLLARFVADIEQSPVEAGHPEVELPELETIATLEIMDHECGTICIELRSERVDMTNAISNDALVFKSDAEAQLAVLQAEIARLRRRASVAQEPELCTTQDLLDMATRIRQSEDTGAVTNVAN